ncbi:hypothetical protein D9619_003617 [Psilocybe cf. subviscida]|uniref:MYND-type domain-containing protein n=1 Tax=Psilocybe cf. subviscida TaxID=2480587 RepID=A0A8H5EUP9_9AGAR|nr:hypothetical protein D9619_003617 [Psilocybe cf. subviscida]
MPAVFLVQPIPASLADLTRKQLETYYWQARNHDGAFKCAALLQHFFDLFPANTQVRVRTVDGKKTQDYIAPAGNRVILEWDMFQPKHLTAALVLPDNMTYITGGQDTAPHAAIGFPDPEGAGFTAILDLAALQYGDVGYGNKGNSLFLLEPVRRYAEHLTQFADENTFESAQISFAIGPTPEGEWLISVAKKAKARLEAKATTPWCGHCGAPPGKETLKMCSKCKNAYYCDADHQKWAWPYHKHFCAPSTPAT